MNKITWQKNQILIGGKIFHSSRTNCLTTEPCASLEARPSARVVLDGCLSRFTSRGVWVDRCQVMDGWVIWSNGQWDIYQGRGRFAAVVCSQLKLTVPYIQFTVSYFNVLFLNSIWKWHGSNARTKWTHCLLQIRAHTHTHTHNHASTCTPAHISAPPVYVHNRRTLQFSITLIRCIYLVEQQFPHEGDLIHIKYSDKSVA